VQNYSYEMVRRCFCADGGVPLIITVDHGTVTDAVYARPAPGHAAGDQASERWLRLTINDIIDRANDTSPAQVKVRWPLGQKYPSSVSIDLIKNAADDEVQFEIRHVSQRP
jgi:hypothetical protein